MKPNIVNAGYDSTNYYLLDVQGGKLLVDCGWPGTLPKLTAVLKRKGISRTDVRYLMVTHFHPDHAGIVQEIKNLGAEFIMMETQPDFIRPMEEMFQRKKLPYLPIEPEGNRTLRFEESRTFLASLGIQGEILATPGHSDDSVSLILDDGIAFTGDLQPHFSPVEQDGVSQASWQRIYAHNITRLYPAHGR